MVYRRLIRSLKQLEGWRPGCQKWQPEVNIFSLSVLRLDKYATFDILKFSIIASLAGNTSARGLLLTWDKRDSPKRTTFYFGEHILGLFGLHPSSLSNSAGFVFLSRKASLVSISAAILLLRSSNVYFLLEFEFRKKSCVEWEHGGEDGISCLLPCIL